jgi:hypothetical protein
MLNKLTKIHPETPRVSDLRAETLILVDSIEIHWIRDISENEDGRRLL